MLRGLPAPSQESGRASAFADAIGQFNRVFQQGYERAQVHRDMHKMDRDDEIVKFAFDTIASRSMGFPDPTVNCFNVTVQSKDSGDEQGIEQANEIVQDLIERLGLRNMSGGAWQIIRRGVKWGNDPYEIVFERDKDGGLERIGLLKPLPEHTVWPNVGPKGDRMPGYVQRMPQMPSTEGGVAFEEYELVLFTFGDEDGYLGTPLMVASRKNWKRLNLAEDSTALARLTRAFAKLIHRVPVNSSDSNDKKNQAIDDYMDKMGKVKIWDQSDETIGMMGNPTDVLTNFYIPDDGTNRGGVEMLDPENAQLQNIKDIEHFQDRLIAATTVPKRYFPFEGSTPKLSEGGGDAEDKNFACTLLMTHAMLQAGLNKLFSIELVLHGIDPREYRFVYAMAPLNTADLLKAAQTAAAKAESR